MQNQSLFDTQMKTALWYVIMICYHDLSKQAVRNYNFENMLPVYTNLSKRDNGFFDNFRLKEAFFNER